MTAFVFAVAKADLGVNGPKDEPLDWNAINWRSVESDVRRLRQRICTASQPGDLKEVPNPQSLMLRSLANALVIAVSQADALAGRKTVSLDASGTGG